MRSSSSGESAITNAPGARSHRERCSQLYTDRACQSAVPAAAIRLDAIGVWKPAPRHARRPDALVLLPITDSSARVGIAGVDPVTAGRQRAVAIIATDSREWAPAFT